MQHELEKLRPYLLRDEYKPYSLYFDVLRALGETDKPESYRFNGELRSMAFAAARRTGKSQFVDLSKFTYLYSARDIFEDYMIYLEWNRAPEKRFYLPRRRVLSPLSQDLQDLSDGKIGFLGVSLPPRTGKSTLCILFMTWLMGRNPDAANVMSGHSRKLTDGFYREVLSILTDFTTYLWADVFPGVTIANTSAEDQTIDLNREKRFPTFTARSIGGTLTGAVEVSEEGCLYVDDLVEDLEESLNPARMQAKYNAYLNQLKDRKKESSFELMVGTRWGVLDPLGRVQDQYADNPRYRFRTVPALNSAGESNFVYDYGKGFSTEYFLDMKDNLDTATWLAKYMGDPRVREGLLFPEDELRYYNGVLPDGDPLIIATCDVAWGGGDSLAMPFAWVFGDSVYIGDVIFNPGDKSITRPIVIGRCKQHRPHKARFEANNGGHEYSSVVDNALRESGVHVNITARRAPSSSKSAKGGGKMARIIQFSPDIKKFYFLAPEYQSQEYRNFMRELTTFTQMGKNPHDDSPDSLAMMADELMRGTTRVEIGKRLW